MEQPVFTGTMIPALMESVERASTLAALQEARQLLCAKKLELIHGPYFPWSLVANAASHLDAQITAIYKAYFAEPTPVQVVQLKDEAGIEAEL